MLCSSASAGMLASWQPYMLQNSNQLLIRCRIIWKPPLPVKHLTLMPRLCSATAMGPMHVSNATLHGTAGVRLTYDASVSLHTECYSADLDVQVSRRMWRPVAPGTSIPMCSMLYRAAPAFSSTSVMWTRTVGRQSFRQPWMGQRR